MTDGNAFFSALGKASYWLNSLWFLNHDHHHSHLFSEIKQTNTMMKSPINLVTIECLPILHHKLSRIPLSLE